MAFISYAQNFEDIRLWRIFKNIQHGFYIDVGANDPVRDSVTKAFYDHGWSGINVEPMPSYYEALCQQRPRDTNLQCVAGETASDLTFYNVPDTGFSTLVESLAQSYKNCGHEVLVQKVESRTLASICEEYVNGRDIYFLKIDVEGHEESVLRGMDFKKWRPWVLIIETPWNRDQAWESLVLDAGYHSVHFDGINTYYLAEERLGFKPGFELPPCNLDEFQFCKGHKFSHPIEEIEQQLGSALHRAAKAEAELRAMQGSRTWRAIQKIKKALMPA